MRKICVKIDHCKQVESLRSREWADDEQFCQAVDKLCSRCQEYQKMTGNRKR